MDLIIHQNKEKIIKLCKIFNVKSLYVFGSAVRNDFKPDSDIDFLIEGINDSEKPIHSFNNYLLLQSALENLLGRKVDLIDYSNLSNPYLKHFINLEKVKIYAEA